MDETSNRGLHYNRFRYYDPETAQYISPDPIGLAGGDRPYGYVHNPISWVDPLGLAKCGFSGKDVGDATNLNILKEGSPEWKKAVDNIKNNQRKGNNYRVETEADALKLLQQGKGDTPNYPTYTDDKYKFGYEVHPNESNTMNAPDNNLLHIKWSDWLGGKKSGGEGHIFYGNN